MADRWALTAVVRLHGEAIDEVRVVSGRSMTIGREGELAVPVPADLPYLAEVRWEGAVAVVTDGLGAEHRLGPDDTYTLRAGPMSVRLSMVRQMRLRRTEPIAFSGSLALLVTVLAATLMASQAELLDKYRCDWLPLFGVYCPVENAQGNGGINAEYLARLLREDYEGEDDQGVVEQDTPVVIHKEIRQDLFMPAGDSGPPEEFGGSEETAPEPVRATEEAEMVAPAKEEAPPLEAVEGVGVPIEQPEPAEEPPPVDAVADADEGFDEMPEEIVEPGEAPKEEKVGWGFRDWIDAETREVDQMVRYAKRRLRIDPDDPDALGILAYYQYLGQDYDAAVETFDRIIELMPESSHGYNNKALVYKRMGEYAKEEGLYRVALALDPSDTTAMNNLAVNLAHQGRHKEALDWMRRLEVALPNDPYSDLHRAKIHADMANEDMALFYLEKALEGMRKLDTLHHIEFRQDIRVDPSFARLRKSRRFHAILDKFYGADAPVRE